MIERHRVYAKDDARFDAMGNTLGIMLPPLGRQQLIYQGLNWAFRWSLSPPFLSSPDYFHLPCSTPEPA